MSEDDPPPENGDGDLVRVAASSDTEFLGTEEVVSLHQLGVKSLDAQIQENGQRMMDAILDLFANDPWELEDLQFSIIVAKIEENIRYRRIYVGTK
jgi:hypothetical protein